MNLNAPADHVCRVIDAFVDMPLMSELGYDVRKPLGPAAAAQRRLRGSSYGRR